MRLDDTACAALRKASIGRKLPRNHCFGAKHRHGWKPFLILYLTVESVLKVYMVSGAGFEALYQRALADAALEDGLFRSTNGRFSFACDLLKITEDFRADAMQSLKERFGTPGTNYVDGNAADGDLTAYMEVLAGAQLAILQFLLKAHINAADLEPARVEGILEVLLPFPRAEYIQHWCGSAGFE